VNNIIALRGINIPVGFLFSAGKAAELATANERTRGRLFFTHDSGEERALS